MKLILKSALRTVFAAALVLSAVSCSSKKTPDTLRMNLTSEPDSFFPWKSAAADTAAIFDNIYEGLYKFDEKGSLYPALAESCEVSEDNLTYTFKLRKDVKFHNGDSFTSKDCVYTYENLAGLNGNTVKSDKFKNVAAVSAADDYTFTVQLKKVSGGFLALTSEPILLHGYENNEELPLGTGPYKFVEYTLHEKVVLKRNENYYNPEKAGKIENIELFVMTDENAVLSALQSQQLDIARMVTATNAKAFEKTFKVISHPQNMVQILGMNSKYAPLSDLNVRKAITCAINKQEIIQGVFDGYATELYSNFSPILGEFYNSELSEINKYSLETAKEYLKKSSYPDGFDLTITVPANYKPHIDTAQVIISQLEKLNINCKIELIEWTTWLDRVYTKFDYQTTVIGFAGKYDPADVLRRYYSTYKRNFTGFNNKDFDSAFDAAEQSTATEKRSELFKECQKILAENVPAVFICDPGLNVLTQKNVAGYTAYPVTFFDFSKMYFE